MAVDGLDVDAILAALRVENPRRCDPALTDEEIHSIVSSEMLIETYDGTARSSTFERFQDESVRRARFHLIGDDDIENRPPPDWLIDELLPTDAVALMYGEPGAGKTFMALDWSFAVASGQVWHGRTVKTGTVVYVAAEGVGGMGVRVRAWKVLRTIEGRVGVHFVESAVILLDNEDVNALVQVIEPVQPRLVVFDTLARCMLDGDEDSSKDMGRLISSVDHIRRATGACVLLVHHPTKKGEKERGSGALRGALETVIKLTPRGSGGEVQLTCEKQKNAPAFIPIQLRLSSVALPSGDTSCAINPDWDTCLIDAQQTPKRDETRALQALIAAGQPLSLDSWRTSTTGAGTNPAAQRTFQRIANALLTRGLVEQPGGRRQPYVATAQGTATANGQPSDSHQVPNSTAATPPPS